MITDNKQFTKAEEIEIPDIFYRRLKTGVEEIDAIFGGTGILPSSTMTLTARAGLGKSTFGYLVGERLCDNGYRVAYASGEESIQQMAFTCKRLGVHSVELSNETNVERLAQKMKDYDFMVIDSFQMLTSDESLTSRKQEKHNIDLLVSLAKETECALMVIMHLTKDGKLKGGTHVPHIVDVNIQILPDKEDKDNRIISVYKNRYGACEDYIARMNQGGFEFGGVYEPQEEVSTESKVSLSKQRENAVLNMKEPPHITMGRVMENLDISRQTAYLLLKELTEKGKVQKFGRGDNAVWKIVGAVTNHLIKKHEERNNDPQGICR